MAPAESPFFLRGRCSAGRTEIRDRGGIFRSRGLPAWTLNYTEAGVGRIDGDGPRFLTRPGDVLLFKPHVRNDYGIEDQQRRWTHLWSVFQPTGDWHRCMAWPEILPGIYRVHLGAGPWRDRVERQFKELVDLARAPARWREDICLHLLHGILLLCDEANPGGGEVLDPRVRDCMQLLCGNLALPYGLDELAVRAGLSVSRFAHLFREQVGLSPMAYHEQQRVLRACDELLMTGRPVAAIAAGLGYEDPAYFARVFKKHMGQTPRAYRQGSPLRKG